MSRPILVLVLLIAIFPLAANDARSETIEITVDCDAGESLKKALHDARARRSVRRGGTARSSDAQICISPGPNCPAKPLIVNIVGTCVVNLLINRDNVTLRGSSPETAVLESAVDADSEPFSPVIQAAKVKSLALENLTIRGAIVGVSVDHSQIAMDNCHVTDNNVGISTIGGILNLVNSEVTSNISGVRVARGVANIVDSAVTGNLAVDLAVSTQASVFVSDGEMNLLDVNFGSFAQVGAVGLRYVEVRHNSQVELRESVDGDVFVAFDSFVHFSNGTITGNFDLVSFSRGVVFHAAVAGTLRCTSGADAVCTASSVGGNLGCAGCSAGP